MVIAFKGPPLPLRPEILLSKDRKYVKMTCFVNAAGFALTLAKQKYLDYRHYKRGRRANCRLGLDHLFIYLTNELPFQRIPFNSMAAN